MHRKENIIFLKIRQSLVKPGRRLFVVKTILTGLSDAFAELMGLGIVVVLIIYSLNKGMLVVVSKYLPINSQGEMLALAITLISIVLWAKNRIAVVYQNNINQISKWISRDIHEGIVERTMDLPYNYYLQLGVNRFAVACAQKHLLIELFASPLLSTIQYLVVLALYVLVGLVVNPILVTGVLLITFGLCVFTIKIQPWVRRFSDLVAKKQEEKSIAMKNLLNGMLDICFTRRSSNVAKYLFEMDTLLIDAKVEGLKRGRFLPLVFEVTIVYGIIGFLIMRGIAGEELSVDSISFMLIFVFRLYPLLNRVSGSVQKVYTGMSYVRFFDSYIVELDDVKKIASKSSRSDRTCTELSERGQRLEINSYLVSYGAKDVQWKGPAPITLRLGGVNIIKGASGVGKTTLLNLLGDVVLPSRMSITTNGCQTTTENMYLGKVLPGFKENAFYLTQFPYINAAPLIQYFGIEGARSPQVSRLVELLERFRLIPNKFNSFEDFEQFLVSDSLSDFSGGERQRLALVKCFLHRRSLVLLDEPTSSLDDASVNTLIDMIGQMNSDTTYVIVTHDERFGNIDNSNVVLIR